MDKNLEQNWHNIEAKKVIEILESDSEQGLKEKDIGPRQEKFGINELPEEKPFSKWRIFLDQFKSPLVYILVIAGAISILLKEWADALVIWMAVFLDVVIGFFQENKASDILRALKKVLKSKALVIRQGKTKEILQEELVPGDIFILRAGQKVPADARLIDTHNLNVNEAALTGEWLASNKKQDILAEKTSLADRENMVYMGTTIEAGKGKAITVHIGTKTEIGKIALMVKQAREEPTPFQKKLAQFSKKIGALITIICLIILLEGWLAGTDPFIMFETTVAVAVSAIPEGLPVAMVVILSLGMQKILKHDGLVRKLASVETLGSTTIIAADKTLTLTQGKMKIAQIISQDKDLTLKIACLCNEAIIENPENHYLRWQIVARPTDKALLLGAAEKGILRPELEQEFKEVDEIPFSSEYKFIAKLFKHKGKNLLYVSGAPEKIIKLSSHIQQKSKRKKFNKKEKILEQLENLTGQGQRVIAVAYKTINNKQRTMNNIKEIHDLVFVGLIGLKDPLRQGVKKIIALTKKAGMKPIIVTGDHLSTAKVVAEEVGLKTTKENLILGQELDELSDKEFQEKLEHINVYARVEPKHKLRIIKAWQDRGEVIAMTGDGINDAPALKQANIGVALGSGTEVAKQASDLILLGDKFSIIVKAIEEGRAIIDNIRKVITYLLSNAFTELILVGASIIAKLPLPVTALQILWVNLIEDGLPDIALAFEPKEDNLMKRKPEPAKIPLLNAEMKALIFIIGIINDLIILGLFFWLVNKGLDINYIRTMIFAALSFDSLLVVFSCKNLRKNIWHINPFSNKLLVISVLSGIILLSSAIYWPPLQILLKTVPLTKQSWLIVILLSIISLGLIEATKYWFITKNQKEKTKTQKCKNKLKN